MTTARRLAPDERRRQIVEAAIPVVAAQGFGTYSLDDIADEAGISRVLLYRYFPRGRPDLSVAVIEAALDTIIGGAVRDPGLDPDDRRRQNLAHFVRYGFGGTPEWRVYLWGLGTQDPEVRAVIERFGDAWVTAAAVTAGLDHDLPSVRLGLRSFIVFGTTALDVAVTQGYAPADVMPLISGLYDDLVARLRAQRWSHPWPGTTPAETAE